MPQNRLIVRTMEHTGLRISDVLSMQTHDLKQRMYVREQKTGKVRRVYLPADLLSDIQNQAGETWAFPGRKPEAPKTRQAVWKDIKRAARAFRMPQNIAPHSIRKFYAVELMNKYGDLERVKKALLHDNIEVTILYAMADRLLSTGAGAPPAKRSGAAHAKPHSAKGGAPGAG
jgi:integrase